ncbi:MAG: oxidase, partial [Nevskiales bacterium]
TGTYWMKHVTSLDISSKPLDNFWMRKAYRVPKGMFPVARPFATQDDDQTSPITEIVVNSLITGPDDGAKVAAAGFTVQGIAWDGGSGIRTVELSSDGGATWHPATLGQNLGRFAFRPWSLRIAIGKPGPVKVMARATSNAGAVQQSKLLFNPAGYNHNVIETLSLTAA